MEGHIPLVRKSFLNCLYDTFFLGKESSERWLTPTH